MFFMLNLKVAMFQWRIVLTLLLQTTALGITSPLPGSTLRGRVEIIGSMAVPEFSSADLEFSYAANPTGTWFLIQSIPQPQTDSILTVWDTSGVTDGDYHLRLRVFMKDGSVQEVRVEGLKIRNDQPEPTTTQEFQPQPAVVSTVPLTPIPTLTRALDLATPLPANAASLTHDDIYRTFGYGAMIATALLLLAAWIVRMRKN